MNRTPALAPLALVLALAACSPAEVESSPAQPAATGAANGSPAPQTPVAEGTPGNPPVQDGSGPTDRPASPEPAGGEALPQSAVDPADVGVLVNKRNPLRPNDHYPADLRTVEVPLGGAGENMMLRDEAAAALERLVAAAADEGHALRLVSGFRSFTSQAQTYEYWVGQFGQAAADERSARPGHSEHQTGLAADVGNADGTAELNQAFGDTEAGRWVARHAGKFGFIIRYPQGMQGITGYIYEPWHLRYVGAGIAGEMAVKSLSTLEEFYQQPAAPTY